MVAARILAGILQLTGLLIASVGTLAGLVFLFSVHVRATGLGGPAGFWDMAVITLFPLVPLAGGVSIYVLGRFVWHETLEPVAG